jgi:NAD(P)-dependent dehydrogenase (short-subunit alcohol dehydrogenase family)
MTRLLDDKVMLVAGVGPSMGSATALVAARERANVALLARRTETSGRIADAIRAEAGEALAVQCDLADAATVRAAFDAVLAEWGRVDAVFYNAASYDHKNTDLDIDELRLPVCLSVTTCLSRRGSSSRRARPRSPSGHGGQPRLAAACDVRRCQDHRARVGRGSYSR